MLPFQTAKIKISDHLVKWNIKYQGDRNFNCCCKNQSDYGLRISLARTKILNECKCLVCCNEPLFDDRTGI